MGDRPKITVIDDPLAAGAGSAPGRARRAAPRAPAAKKPEASANGSAAAKAEPRDKPASADLSAEPLTAVFGRVPASLARRLEGMVFQLRGERKVSQQDVLAALLLRFVDHADERSVAEIHRLLDGYEKARAPRRGRATHSG